MSTTTTTNPEKGRQELVQSSFYFRFRMFLDKFMRYGVAFGGISIIIAITLIFLYLLAVVFPIFHSAEISQTAAYRLAEAGSGNTTLHLAIEEQNEVGLQVTKQGGLRFFDTRNGETITSVAPNIPTGVNVTSFAQATPEQNTVAFGLANGEVLLLQHRYKVTFPDDKRLITPQVVTPLGADPLLIDTQNEALVKLATQRNEEGVTFAATTADKRLIFVSYIQEESLFDDAEIERTDVELPYPATEVTHLLIDKDQRELYVVSQGGHITFFDIQDKAEPKLMQHLTVTDNGAEISAIESLTGGISLIVGTDKGELAQWSLLRGENNQEQLVKFREFESHDAAITQIVPEFSRKAFVALDEKGTLGIYHTTAERTVLKQAVIQQAFANMAMSPRANGMVLLGEDGQASLWDIDNEHPEISFSSLWGKVWYESYPEPDYIWQSSSASNDFEPKFSLVPISFGTLKAAFYAMIVAVPLAIMGAIFTAQFMSPNMRRVVKPSIEIMEALPTVILGFLAGLWLAPFVEDSLPGILLMLFLMPMSILLAAYLWQLMPPQVRFLIPDGWEGALLIPAVVFVGWFSFALSPHIELWLFDGNMPQWLSTELGIGYDQRNSIVVGLAMGFAVIPTIFSIAEDALFAVPKHLVNGSLALGATPWQTLVRVVLLTASPGIFSAVMIGLGRAVGETMIVLMATGNTPVMDFSIFQGMRTLSANIAVEMPESEVDSTHYRVLFLAALVLFAFTFLFNTLAEIVRQRLRRKYSSL